MTGVQQVTSSEIHVGINYGFCFFVYNHPLTVTAKHFMGEMIKCDKFCLHDEDHPFVSVWRDLNLFGLNCIMVSNQFLCHFVRNYFHMCKHSQALSNYPHIFIYDSNVGSAFEAHKWISSRLTAVPCFPTAMHLGTVTPLFNLEDLCSGLKHQKAANTLQLAAV